MIQHTTVWITRHHEYADTQKHIFAAPSKRISRGTWFHHALVHFPAGDWDYTGSYNLDFEEEDDDDYSGCYQGDSEERYVVIDDDADVDESEMPDDDTDEEHGDIIRQVETNLALVLFPSRLSRCFRPSCLDRFTLRRNIWTRQPKWVTGSAVARCRNLPFFPLVRTTSDFP